jgi:hypothetical protein
MPGGFVNASRVAAQVRGWGEGARHGLRRQLRREYELVLAKSQVYVPRDTGALAATGQVTGPIEVGDTSTVAVSYGGSDAPYAEVVHERLDTRHEPPTQAKYLERAVQEQERGMSGRLAASAKREGRQRMPATIGAARRRG